MLYKNLWQQATDTGTDTDIRACQTCDVVSKQQSKQEINKWTEINSAFRKKVFLLFGSTHDGCILN